MATGSGVTMNPHYFQPLVVLALIALSLATANWRKRNKTSQIGQKTYTPPPTQAKASPPLTEKDYLKDQLKYERERRSSAEFWLAWAFALLLIFGTVFLNTSCPASGTLPAALQGSFFGRSGGTFRRVFVTHLLKEGFHRWPAGMAIWGPWRELGNPCHGADAATTFHSQSAFVIPVASKSGAFIFMADRWDKRDLPKSRYVWLPVQFKGDAPDVEWLDQWDLSFFDRRAP